MSHKIGSYQNNLPPAKDRLDFLLTRFPRLYLFVEEHREWQNWDKRVYLSVIEQGDTVIDVGANVGAHTVAFSHLVGREGRVLSFEPVPPNFERLCETVANRTRYRNTSLFALAFGNPAAPGERILMKVPGDDFTQASLVEHSAGSWQASTSVRDYAATLTSLDAQASELRLCRLDFIKIDVEGGELDVIKGAANTIRRFLPLLYCEVYEKWAASFEYIPADLFGLAASLGYTQARVIRGGEVYVMMLTDPVPSGLFNTSADVLFVAPHQLARVSRFDKRFVGGPVVNHHDRS